MKKVFLSFFLLSAVLISCQKSSVKPQSAPVTVTSDDESTEGKTNFELLTAQTWVYSKYYIEYVDATNPGKLAYKRGRERNQVVLDSTTVTYLTDGTYDEMDEDGNHLMGTWTFTDPEETIISVTDSEGGITTKSVILLNRRKFYWADDENDVAAQMIGKP